MMVVTIAGFLPTIDEWQAALKRIQELEAQLQVAKAIIEQLEKERSGETNSL
jgi:hypothetical protein